MPFTAQIEKDMRVRVPDDFVKGMNLHVGDTLTLEIVPLMGQKSYKQLETELGRAQEYEISMNTLHYYLPMWMKNFKENLPKFVSGARSFADIEPVEPAEKRRCVVIANGPSLYEADLSPLKDFQGTIVTTNKPLKHLLENGVVPDYVTALDSEDIVFESFDHQIVREKASHMRGILLPTTVSPKVADFAVEHFGHNKVFWSNPRFSEAIAPNICETLTSITTIPSCDHGGNVGTFSYLMAIRPLLCDPIGLLGFDLSYKPDPNWPLEHASLYRYFYLPKRDTGGDTIPRNAIYALTPAFEFYLTRLMELWAHTSEKQRIRTVNLTPYGPLNAVIGILNQDLSTFCARNDK